MKRLILALALVLGSWSQLQAQPATNFPTNASRPVFLIPASAVNGSGTFTPQLFGPQSCTVPAYSFTSATTSGFGLASSTPCVVVGGTQRLGISSTLATFTVPIIPTTTNTLSLGDSTHQWGEAYILALGVGVSPGGSGTINLGAAGTTTITSETTATLQLGVDAAGVTDQAIKGPDRITSDGVGGALTLAGGRNRGASAGGSIIFQTSPAAGAGNPGTLATALTIDSTKLATFAGSITSVAGTTAIPPLTVTNGTNLTTATANAIENDGTAFYQTMNTTNGRTFNDGWNEFRLSGSGSGITTIADFYGSNSGIPLVNNGRYEIEWVAYFSQATAGTATWTVTTATTALANITGEYMCSNIAGIGTVGAPQTAAINTTASSATAFPVTGTEATAVTHYCRLRVMLVAGNGASNTRLRLTMSAGTATPLINSYQRVRQLPSGNTGTYVP